MPETLPRTSSAGRRAIVLGLDGAPYSLLERFTREGLMPNLRAAFERGAAVPMDTAIPEISSVAWASFMTGVNPGKHGVYGFLDLDPRSYKLRFTNYQSLRAEPVWERLGRAGKRSVVVNVPGTYPARPMPADGVLVSGFVAIDLARATYPPRLLPWLQGMGYKLDVETQVVANGMDALVAELWLALEKRVEALLELFTSESWSLFIGVVTETDRLHHYLWAAIEDPNHAQHGFFLDYYRRIDAFLGRIFEQVRPDDLVVLMSDHGFCAIDHEVYLNHWLRREGYVDFQPFPPRSHEAMTAGTRAFAMDPARIHVHAAGEFARGSVAAGEARRQLGDELRERLGALEIDGRRVVRDVYRREELYSGAHLGEAPDLVLVPNRGFDLKGTILKDALTGRSLLTGMHTQDDAVLYANRPLAKSGRAHIVDIVPTLLAWLGEPVPAELDGALLVAP